MTNHDITHAPGRPEAIPAPTSQVPANGEATQVPASHEIPHALTNRTAAIRLTFLMSQLIEEPPPLRTRLTNRLSPISEEHRRMLLSLSAPTHHDHEEAAMA